MLCWESNSGCCRICSKFNLYFKHQQRGVAFGRSINTYKRAQCHWNSKEMQFVSHSNLYVNTLIWYYDLMAEDNNDARILGVVVISVTLTVLVLNFIIINLLSTTHDMDMWWTRFAVFGTRWKKPRFLTQDKMSRTRRARTIKSHRTLSAMILPSPPHTHIDYSTEIYICK